MYTVSAHIYIYYSFEPTVNYKENTVNPISLMTIMFNVFVPVGMLTSIKTLTIYKLTKNDIFYKKFQQLYSIRERIHCSVVSKMPTVSNGFLIQGRRSCSGRGGRGRCTFFAAH